jgi:hypothetical protein
LIPKHTVKTLMLAGHLGKIRENRFHIANSKLETMAGSRKFLW